jgi:hypothetical protein
MMGALQGIGLAAAVLSLAACATQPPPAPCAAGHQAIRTAQLFVGRAGAPHPSDEDFSKFVEQELTPRFPDGLTVLDGGAKWSGPENAQIRDAWKVVQIAYPPGRDGDRRIAAAEAAYKARFHQDPVVVVAPPACVAL